MIAALPLTKPYIPVPKLELFLAAVFSGVVSGVGGGIILISLFLFDLKIALYTIVSMWVCGKVTDKVIDGLSSNKSVMIISDDNNQIATRIMEELGRGVTFLAGQGGYSGDSKMVINCIANHFEIPRLKEIVLDTDPQAFMFITETTEVSGVGFTIPMLK